MKLLGKRALVTGAIRGIGAAIAKALAAQGANLAITYDKSTAAASDVVNAIRSMGREAVALKADSADSTAVAASVEAAVTVLGGLDILVNNVGIIRFAPIKDVALEDIDSLLSVNVRAPILACKTAAPHLGSGGASSTSEASSLTASRRGQASPSMP